MNKRFSRSLQTQKTTTHDDWTTLLENPVPLGLAAWGYRSSCDASYCADILPDLLRK